MKKKVLIGLTLCLLLTPLLAQPSNQITQALSKGDINTLSQFLGDEVALTINKESKELSKKETTEELVAFFSKNKVVSFEMKHQGDRNGSAYIMGELTTSNGAFRVNCFLKKSDKGLYIHRIRIEE
ncbi:MAG: DUF4783 domain-containing protein [Bacteroides sp.]|nr:DUF4783 domain-containing protein [Bacteroides sp.]MDD2645830.1 DUF4783 domain-containing protein [Bacteroides sp.]MDD4055572.1 DUF4783 domain-containing protein [Bacteroides sp.]MDD4720468.1 DUF4783 domain-containing protein [Bacteroides sp.]